MLELRSRSNDAAEAALLAPMRDPPLPGGARPVYTSHMDVDSYQVGARRLGATSACDKLDCMEIDRG